VGTSSEVKIEPAVWNERKVRDALAQLSMADLDAELRAVGLNDFVFDALCTVLRDSESVIFRYPAKQKEAKRDALFDMVMQLVSDERGADDEERIKEIRRTIEIAENGYREILSSLAKATISKLPPTRQLWAAVTRAAAELDQVRQTAVYKPGSTLGTSVQGQTSSGMSTDVDGAAFIYSAFVTILIGMLARTNGWAKPDGRIILPDMIAVDNADLAAAADIVNLGVSWYRWVTAETRARLWAGRLEERDARPEDQVPPQAKHLRLHHPSYADLPDWIAHQRLADVAAQSFGDTMMESSIGDLVMDADGVVPLPPGGFLSLMEASSAGLLFDFIALDPLDTNSYHGCTLLEWVRGYALLGSLAAGTIAEGTSAVERGFLSLTPDNLAAHLSRVGLSEASAKAFIANATMHIDTDDLFDCPLLECADGSLILLTGVAADCDPARIALSNLTRLEEEFKAKGKAFERSVLEFFKEKGFDAYSIDTKRDGEPYELDVLVPWDDHLFVFECKNRGPSNLKPRLAYNQARDRTKFRKQLQRQIDGLLCHPDMSIAVSGIDPREKTIVPVVLYSLPVADEGADESISLTDWSSLTRFFRERYVHIKNYHEVEPNKRVLHRIAIHDLWKGDEPTPKRFAEELRYPFQTKLMMARCEGFPSLMRFSDDTFGITVEWSAGEMDMKRLSDFFGFDPASVTKLQKEAIEAVRQVRKKRKKRVRKTRR